MTKLTNYDLLTLSRWLDSLKSVDDVCQRYKEDDLSSDEIRRFTRDTLLHIDKRLKQDKFYKKISLIALIIGLILCIVVVGVFIAAPAAYFFPFFLVRVRKLEKHKGFLEQALQRCPG